MSVRLSVQWRERISNEDLEYEVSYLESIVQAHKYSFETNYAQGIAKLIKFLYVYEITFIIVFLHCLPSFNIKNCRINCKNTHKFRKRGKWKFCVNLSIILFVCSPVLSINKSRINFPIYLKLRTNIFILLGICSTDLVFIEIVYHVQGFNASPKYKKVC